VLGLRVRDGWKWLKIVLSVGFSSVMNHNGSKLGSWVLD
jgi:hypothetical protein